MKQKDILLIGVVAFIAAIFSFILSGALFGSPQKNPTKVPVVTPISATFPDVKNDSNYNTVFNGKAINPTQIINIGNNKNPTPFQSDSNQ